VGNNGGHGNASRAKQGRLEDVVQTARGAILSGSTAAMDGAVLLDPEFARWLQGLPDIWSACAVTATDYVPKSPSSSSPPISRLIEDPMLTLIGRWVKPYTPKE
jgi:hypothetical protein